MMHWRYGSYLLSCHCINVGFRDSDRIQLSNQYHHLPVQVPNFSYKFGTHIMSIELPVHHNPVEFHNENDYTPGENNDN